jgi:hypothetical protein
MRCNSTARSCGEGALSSSMFNLCIVSGTTGVFAGLAKTLASKLIAIRYASALTGNRCIVKIESIDYVTLRVLCERV